MKIKDLSFCTEIIEENATNVNGGYFDYDAVAEANARWLDYAGDSLEIIGFDGGNLYDASDAWGEYYYWE